MKRTIFTKSTTALILTLLVLGAFFPKELSQKLMAGAIILWLAILCGQFLIRHSGRGIRRISLHKIRTFFSGKYRAEKCTVVVKHFCNIWFEKLSFRSCFKRSLSAII